MLKFCDFVKGIHSTIFSFIIWTLVSVHVSDFFKPLEKMTFKYLNKYKASPENINK